MPIVIRFISSCLSGGSVCLMLGLYALSSATLSNAAAAPVEETAVFAGGCFWGVDAVFKHVKGVSEVVQAIRAAARPRRITNRSARATPGMPNRCVSVSTRRK